jgi:hypothetical protein
MVGETSYTSSFQSLVLPPFPFCHCEIVLLSWCWSDFCIEYLGAGHHTAHVVYATCVVNWVSVGVSRIGKRVSSVHSSIGGGGQIWVVSIGNGGNHRLYMGVGLSHITGGVVHISGPRHLCWSVHWIPSYLFCLPLHLPSLPHRLRKQRGQCGALRLDIQCKSLTNIKIKGRSHNDKKEKEGGPRTGMKTCRRFLQPWGNTQCTWRLETQLVSLPCNIFSHVSPNVTWS